MGLLTSAALVTASFLLGVLFTSSVWDGAILYSNAAVTETTLMAVENYYLTWWNAATTVKMFLHVIVIVLFMSLVGKFARKSETAYYFSGASLLLLILTTAVYIVITIPAIRLIAADPLDKTVAIISGPDFFTRMQAYFAKSNTGPLGDRARESVASVTESEPLTWATRLEHDSVLAAGNTIAIALLVGVILLQVSEWYLEESIAKETAQFAAQEAAQPKEVTEEKKTQ